MQRSLTTPELAIFPAVPMPLYHSVLKRYTAPTCNLEILARSPVNEAESRRSRISPHSFQLQIHYLESGSALASANDPTQISIALRGTLDQLQVLHRALQDYLYKFLGKTDLNRFLEESVTVPLESQDIAVIPKTLTQHTLQLGSLGSDIPISEVQLASTQLLDLSTTLDSYANEASEVVKQHQYRSQIWAKAGRIAAVGVAVTGLGGLMASLLSMNRDTLVPQMASKAEQNSSSTTALQNQQAPLNAQHNLPGVPVGSALPAGGMSGTPAATLTPTPMGLPTPIPTVSATLSVPSTPIPQTSQLPAPTPTVVFTPIAPQPIAIAPSRVLQPARPTPVSGGGIASRPSTQTRAVRPPLPPAVPPVMENPPVASVPAPASADTFTSQLNTNPANPALRSQPLETLAPLGKSASVSEDARAAASGTVFDTIQQVGEVRQYFQNRWQPPASISQVLEYHLMLNSDGSLWQIVPLGEAAGRNLDRTGMPPMGNAFVSPIPRNQRAKIRLVLFPDGKVQTFLEGLTP